MITTRIRNLLLVALIVVCIVLQGCSPKLPEKAASALDEYAGYVVSDDIASVVKAKYPDHGYGVGTDEILCITLNSPAQLMGWESDSFTLARTGNLWIVYATGGVGSSNWKRIGCTD